MMPVQANPRIHAELPKGLTPTRLQSLIIVVAAVAGAALGYFVAGLVGLAIGAIATIAITTHFLRQSETSSPAVVSEPLPLDDSDYQGRSLIRFYEFLFIPGKPKFWGSDEEKAQQIQDWMRQSQEVENLETLVLVGDNREPILGNCLFGRLPKEIGLFRNLKILDLRNHLFRRLPPEIGNLKALTHLDLSNNNLFELPSQIENLASLQCLDLKHNCLRELPPDIRNLRSLTFLDLSDNHFHSFPAEIQALPSLEELNLTQNPIQLWPDQIGQLQQIPGAPKGHYRRNTPHF